MYLEPSDICIYSIVDYQRLLVNHYQIAIYHKKTAKNRSYILYFSLYYCFINDKKAIPLSHINIDVVYTTKSMEFIHFIIDFILHIDRHLLELVENYGVWVYAILFLIVFCETGLVVTPFLPGDSLLFVAGALAASNVTGDFNIIILNIILITAAILGDGVNYTIGRFFGEKLFSNPDSKIFKQSYLEKTHHFYEKHGGKTIILARFVPIVRTFAPFVAGMGHMGYKHFAAFNVIGGVIWVVLFTLLGYFVGTIEWVQQNLKLLMIAIIFLSIVPAIVEVIRERAKSKKEA